MHFIITQIYEKVLNLLEFVEILDDDADEEVEGEEWTNHDEDNEEENRVVRVVLVGLHIFPANVRRVTHNLHPAFERRLQHHNQVTAARYIEDDSKIGNNTVLLLSQLGFTQAACFCLYSLVNCI